MRAFNSTTTNPSLPRRASTLVVAALALVAGACGSESPPAELGADPAGPTSTIPTTTLPPTTTTSIDFDVPVDDVTTPLAEAPTVADLGAIVDDLRGPTGDVTAQMARLGTFVPLTSVTRALVLEISLSAESVPDLGVRVVSMVTAHVPGEARGVAALIGDELRATGWNRAQVADESAGEEVSVETTYRIPGTPGDELELLVGVEGGPGEATVLRLRRMASSPDNDAVLDQLTAWLRGLPVPPGSTVVGAAVTTVDDRGVLSVTYRTAADSPAEARALLADRVPRDGFELAAGAGSAGGRGEPLTLVDPDGTQIEVRFDTSPDPELMELMASTEVGLRPVG